MKSPATIKIDRTGIGSVVIDGHDISMYVSPEFTATSSQPGGPVVTLTLKLIDLNLEVDGAADVDIPDELAVALEALGWTRPERDLYEAEVEAGTRYGEIPRPWSEEGR